MPHVLRPRHLLRLGQVLEEKDLARRRTHVVAETGGERDGAADELREVLRVDVVHGRRPVGAPPRHAPELDAARKVHVPGDEGRTGRHVRVEARHRECLVAAHRAARHLQRRAVPFAARLRVLERAQAAQDHAVLVGVRHLLVEVAEAEALHLDVLQVLVVGRVGMDGILAVARDGDDDVPVPPSARGIRQRTGRAARMRDRAILKRRIK